MRAEEARDVLGVEPAASADEIRRAYLRAVKRCSPERDPEGFRRVREAFEVCRVTASRDTATEVEDSQVEAPAEEGEGVARAQRTAEQIASALRAWRGGTLPESARAELRERLGDRPFPLALAPLLVDDYPRAVVDAIDGTISWMEAQPRPKPLGSPMLWRWLEPVLTTILMLVSAGEAQLARQCVERVMEHERRRPDLARLGLDHRWLLVRDLMNLPASLPPGLARVLARELLVMEREFTSTLSVQARAYLAIQAGRMRFRYRLSRSAPNLYALCYGRRRLRVATLKPKTWRSLTLIACAVIVLLCHAAYRNLRGPGVETPPPVRRVYAAARTAGPVGPPAASPAQRAHQREAALRVLRRFCDGGDHQFCADLVRLMGAVDRASCVDARAALAALDYPEGRLDAFLRRPEDRLTVREVVVGLCPVGTGGPAAGAEPTRNASAQR